MKCKKASEAKESLDNVVVDATSVSSLSSPHIAGCEVIDLVSPEPDSVRNKFVDGSSAIEREVSAVGSSHDPTSLNVTALEKAVKSMSTSEANSLFTALRKAANHPLLLRYVFLA